MSELNPDYVRAIEAAGVAVAMSDRGTAERALRAAIHAVEVLGPDDADLVLALNDLIRLSLKQSLHVLAEPLLLRLLDIKRSKGEEHPEFVTVLASLAAVRQALGRNDEAEQLWRTVIAIRERTLAPNHFSLATALEHLSDTCAARGKFTDALQCSQRALVIREATLGREHASLRSSRERIADLELQAGEDILDRGPTPSASHARPSIVPAGVPEIARPPMVVSEKPALLLHSEPVVADRPERPSNPTPAVQRRPSPVPPPPPSLPQAPAARKSPAPGKPVALVPVPIKPEAYFSVLETLKDEIEVGHTRTPATTFQARIAALVVLLRQPRAAAIVGIGAITLPLAAWGVAGATRSSELTWVDQKPTMGAAVSRPDTNNLALAAGIGTTASAVDRRKDSSSSPAGKAGTLGGATKSEASTKPVVVSAEPVITLQGARRVNISLDSIGTPMPAAVVNEPLLRQLAAASDLGASKSLAPMGAPQRARMIGALPTPRYPAQQLRGGTGGSVRVRFDVDTSGRPVMSTFSVVSSPLPQFAASVKDVISGIRFEPARTPFPESRATVETVELTFQFAPLARK